jgi:sugar phosphate isomerase/epimerase
MKRRDFLLTAAAAAGGGMAASRAWARETAPAPAKLDRVAIMTYSFDRIIKSAASAAYPGASDGPPRTLDILDVPQMFADRYGVHNIEIQHDHFPSTESAYLKEFRARMAKTKSRLSNINLEFVDALTISAANTNERLQAVELSKRWIDLAVELGSPRVMVNQGRLSEERKATAIEALRAIGAYAKTRKIKVGMEPRGGGRPPAAAPGAPPPPTPAPTAYIDLMAEVIKQAGTYTNVDLGNLGDQTTQQYGIRVLMPMTDGNTHVKLNPARYDLPAALALTKQMGYTGLYSIEGSTQGDPYDNVQKIYDVLIANL